MAVTDAQKFFLQGASEPGQRYVTVSDVQSSLSQVYKDCENTTGLVSAESAGAIGDGVADDTAAIQKALNSSRAIYLPAGTYKVSGLTISDHTRIYGDGQGVTTLHWDGTTGAVLTGTGTSARPVSLVLENLSIDGQKKAATGVSASFCNVVLKSVEAFDCYAGGVSLTTCDNFIINDLMVHDNGVSADVSGLSIASSKFGSASAVVAERNGKYGIKLLGVSYSDFSGVTASSNAEAAVYVSGSGAVGGSNNCAIRGLLATNGKHAVLIDQASWNIQISNSVIDQHTDDAVRISTATNVLLAGATISNSAGYGIHLTGASDTAFGAGVLYHDNAGGMTKEEQGSVFTSLTGSQGPKGDKGDPGSIPDGVNDLDLLTWDAATQSWVTTANELGDETNVTIASDGSSDGGTFFYDDGNNTFDVRKITMDDIAEAANANDGEFLKYDTTNGWTLSVEAPALPTGTLAGDQLAWDAAQAQWAVNRPAVPATPYANAAALPAAPKDGALAVTLDDNSLYIASGGNWVKVKVDLVQNGLTPASTTKAPSVDSVVTALALKEPNLPSHTSPGDDGKLLSHVAGGNLAWVAPIAPATNTLTPVATKADLPAAGNTAGDVRVTQDDGHLHIWAGNPGAWSDIGPAAGNSLPGGGSPGNYLTANAAGNPIWAPVAQNELTTPSAVIPPTVDAVNAALTQRSFPAPTAADKDKILTVNAAGAATWSAVSPGSVGEIAMFTTWAVPDGWLLCDGSQFSSTTYPELYAFLGTDRTPDLRGKFVRGAYGGYNPLQTQDQATARPTTPFTTDNQGNHNHTIRIGGGGMVDSWDNQPGSYPAADSNWAWGNPAKDISGSPMQGAAGNHSHTVTGGGDSETRPANIALAYAIRSKPIKGAKGDSAALPTGTAGQVLLWDATKMSWQPGAPVAGATELKPPVSDANALPSTGNTLGDIRVTLSDGHMHIWTAGTGGTPQWDNIGPAAVAARLVDLADVSATGSVQGDALTYDGTGKWLPTHVKPANQSGTIFMGTKAFVPANLRSQVANYGMDTDTVPDPKAMHPKAGDLYLNTENDDEVFFYGRSIGHSTEQALLNLIRGAVSGITHTPAWTGSFGLGLSVKVQGNDIVITQTGHEPALSTVVGSYMAASMTAGDVIAFTQGGVNFSYTVVAADVADPKVTFIGHLNAALATAFAAAPVKWSVKWTLPVATTTTNRLNELKFSSDVPTDFVGANNIAFTGVQGLEDPGAGSVTGTLQEWDHGYRDLTDGLFTELKTPLTATHTPGRLVLHVPADGTMGTNPITFKINNVSKTVTPTDTLGYYIEDRDNAQPNDVLSYDGTKWVPKAGGAGGGGASTLAALTDTDTTTNAPAAGMALVYNGTRWVPQAISTSAVTTWASGKAYGIGALVVRAADPKVLYMAIQAIANSTIDPLTSVGTGTPQWVRVNPDLNAVNARIATAEGATTALTTRVTTLETKPVPTALPADPTGQPYVAPARSSQLLAIYIRSEAFPAAGSGAEFITADAVTAGKTLGIGQWNLDKVISKGQWLRFWQAAGYISQYSGDVTVKVDNATDPTNLDIVITPPTGVTFQAPQADLSYHLALPSSVNNDRSDSPATTGAALAVTQDAQGAYHLNGGAGGMPAFSLAAGSAGIVLLIPVSAPQSLGTMTVTNAAVPDLLSPAPTGDPGAAAVVWPGTRTVPPSGDQKVGTFASGDFVLRDAVGGTPRWDKLVVPPTQGTVNSVLRLDGSGGFKVGPVVDDLTSGMAVSNGFSVSWQPLPYTKAETDAKVAPLAQVQEDLKHVPIMFKGTGPIVLADIADPAKNYGMPAGTVPDPQVHHPESGDEYVDTGTQLAYKFTGHSSAAALIRSWTASLPAGMSLTAAAGGGYDLVQAATPVATTFYLFTNGTYVAGDAFTLTTLKDNVTMSYTLTAGDIVGTQVQFPAGLLAAVHAAFDAKWTITPEGQYGIKFVAKDVSENQVNAAGMVANITGKWLGNYLLSAQIGGSNNEHDKDIPPWGTSAATRVGVPDLTIKATVSAPLAIAHTGPGRAHIDIPVTADLAQPTTLTIPGTPAITKTTPGSLGMYVDHRAAAAVGDVLVYQGNGVWTPDKVVTAKQLRDIANANPADLTALLTALKAL